MNKETFKFNELSEEAKKVALKNLDSLSGVLSNTIK